MILLILSLGRAVVTQWPTFQHIASFALHSLARLTDTTDHLAGQRASNNGPGFLISRTGEYIKGGATFWKR